MHVQKWISARIINTLHDRDSATAAKFGHNGKWVWERALLRVLYGKESGDVLTFLMLML